MDHMTRVLLLQFALVNVYLLVMSTAGLIIVIMCVYIVETEQLNDRK